MQVASGWMATLCCDDCGAQLLRGKECKAAVVSYDPGDAPDPIRGWCQACAAKHGWLQEEAAA